MKTKKEKMIDLMGDADELIKGWENNMAFSLRINQLSGLADDANEDPNEIDYTDEQLNNLIDYFEAVIEDRS